MSIGSRNLTQPDPELAAQAKRTYPGMAHFAGSGPHRKCCKDCKWFGYYRESRSGNLYKVGGCEKFYRLTGHPGPAFTSTAAACKYFEERKKDEIPM